MITEFSYANDGEASGRDFQAWRDAHRRGYVINSNGRASKLHYADCQHFFDADAAVNNTKKPKICSTDPAELQGWAREHGIEELTGCKSCKLG